jgi:hypothetical protein
MYLQYVYIYTYVSVYMYSICMQVCIYIYIYVYYMYACMHIYVHIYYIHIYVRMYTHAHTHTQTHRLTHQRKQTLPTSPLQLHPPPPAPTTCNTPHKSAAPAAPRELSQILKSQQKRPPTGQKRPATVQKDLLQDALTQKFSKVSKRDLLLGKRDLRRHYRERFTECVPAACEFARMLISPLRIEK